MYVLVPKGEFYFALLLEILKIKIQRNDYDNRCLLHSAKEKKLSSRNIAGMSLAHSWFELL